MTDKSRQRILSYMRTKDKMVYREAALRLYVEEDYEDVESWSEDDCRNVVASLRTCLENGALASTDSMLCPQCIKSLNSSGIIVCSRCSYGKRHGSCLFSPTSRYIKIVILLTKSSKGIFTSIRMALFLSTQGKENLQKLLDCLK